MKKPNPINRDYLRYISGLPKDQVEAAWDDMNDTELDQAYEILENDLAEAFMEAFSEEDVMEIMEEIAPSSGFNKNTLH